MKAFDDLESLSEWNAALEVGLGEFLVEDDVRVQTELFMMIA
jgi:hypothetical protein